MRFLLTLLLASAGGVDVILDSPPAITGNCNPSRVHFTARITAGAPGKITYVWRRSDNGASSTQTLEFAHPGTLPVSYDWLLRRSTTGWVSVKILTPAAVESPKSKFELTCR